MIQTDLGYGRGWASPEAGASIARIDAQLGRPAQITEAGRSAADADANAAAWAAYQAGDGPRAPFALDAAHSVHCTGNAADTDDYRDPHADAVWAANGWVQTARYDDPDKDEPWHREYFPDRDQHLNDPTTPLEDTEMSMKQIRRVEDGTIYLIDELGADSLLDFATDDISLEDLTGSTDRVFGASEDVNAREFGVAVAIAERRWDRKRAQIVADLVKALNG